MVWLILLFFAPAMAISCEDIRGLLDAGTPAAIVEQTIREASPPPTKADLECLQKSAAPEGVLNAVRTLVGVPVPPPPTIPTPPILGNLTLEYDCLAGLCLNANATKNIPDQVVKIGDRWHTLREVEVCSGKIVKISISRGIRSDSVDITYMPDETVGFASIEGSQFSEYLLDSLPQTGWYIFEKPKEDANGFMVAWVKSQASLPGQSTYVRIQSFTRLTDSHGMMIAGVWTLQANHPEYRQLCQSRDLSGL